ncbi:MAG: cation:proton antiporter [Acidiferrobacterales bacterium]
MEPIWLAIAFVLGLGARQLGLPSLVGFLLAGFVLSAVGVESGEFIREIADAGVTLLLFTIGLKLRVQTLLRPHVWAVATAHMAATVALFAGLLFALAAAGIALTGKLDLTLALLIGFALSFSSTVFAVKLLEEKGEMASLHGRIAIGILIMQDLIAVIFLAVSAGKLPSPWALALLALIPLRGVLTGIMARSGHGELLILYGLLLALGGAAVFESVGIKGDLGALILGVLLAGHPKASQLAKTLLGFKDLFLIGFFLNIGLSGALSLHALGIAALLVLLLPLKVLLYFFLLARSNVRARTSLLASLSLANYSEFGLIVGAIAVANGWFTSDWLVIIALALSISFILASPLNTAAHAIYAHYADRLRRFETPTRLPEEQPFDTGDAEIVICGMGRVGSGAYDCVRRLYGDIVTGVDTDPDVVREQAQAGRNVIQGDATDPDLWERGQPGGKIRLVMLAIPNHSENLYIAKTLARSSYRGQLTATAKHADQVRELEQEGVHAAFDIYAEAGAGFAEDVRARLKI